MQRLSKTGFSLMETLVVIAILSVMSIALTRLIIFFYRSNSYEIQEGTAVQNAQHGLTNALQDLRESSYGDDGSYPISNAGTSTVTFYADTNGNGSVEKVRIYLLNGTLYRGVTTSVGNPPSYSGQTEKKDIIATYVTNTTTSVFQYYDNAGTLLSSPINVSSIAAINTTLTIDVDPSHTPTPYTMTGSATLRNLR